MEEVSIKELMNVIYRLLLIWVFCIFAHAESKSPQKINPNAESAPDPTQATQAVEEIKPYIASLSVFGSKKINENDIRKFLGKDLDKWFNEGLNGDPQKAIKMQTTLTQRIKNKYKFAYVDWSIMEYFQPGDLAIRVTLDVVEKKDVKERMPFKKQPIGSYADPGQLITTWNEYVATALDLANTGGLDSFGEECSLAFHCLFGHDHPKLKTYGDRFEEGVKKYESRLVTIAKSHRDPEFRASAVFILAYLNNGPKLVKVMIDASRDPSPLVRNNALRVLGDITDLHPQIVVPPSALIEALSYPTVTDRSKAVYALFGMVENSKANRSVVLKNAVGPLLKLLASSQPNESEPAYAVLKRISDKDFAKSDFSKWKNWAQRLPAQK